MRKGKITKAEYLQFVGLDTLARQHSQMVNKIRDAMYQLLGSSEHDDMRGEISDLLWAPDSTNVDMALKGLGIEVEQGEEVHADS